MEKRFKLSLAATVLAATAPAGAANKTGFIYVGSASDYGYNMSMDLGRFHVEETLGVETTAFEAIDGGSWEPGHVRGDLASGHAILDPFGEVVLFEVAAAFEASTDFASQRPPHAADAPGGMGR